MIKLRSLAQLHESLDWFARSVLNLSKTLKVRIFIFITVRHKKLWNGNTTVVSSFDFK